MREVYRRQKLVKNKIDIEKIGAIARYLKEIGAFAAGIDFFAEKLLTNAVAHDIISVVDGLKPLFAV